MSRLSKFRRNRIDRRARLVRNRPRLEVLEDRTLLSDLSINSVSIVLSPPGPASVSGSLNPSDPLAAYRIDGTAGERLQFHSVSTSSTEGSWELIAENNREVAGNSLGADFTANLTTTGPYYLELVGSSSSEINYSFQISDISDAPVATSGLDAPQSGTLAADTSTTFTFTASAGLPVYFNSFDRSYGPVTATLTDPNGSSIFSSVNASDNEGPYVLTSSGSYTITLNNSSGSARTYSFDMLSLSDSATSLALGPAQTVGGTLDPGTTTAVYSFPGAAGEQILFDEQQNPGDPVKDRLIAPDNSQIFDVGSYGGASPTTLTESGTYYLLVDGESSSPISYQFELTDTAYAPLAFNTQNSGSFGSATSANAYSFAGTASEIVTFNSLDDSAGPYAASWTLFGPNDSQVAGSGASENFSATLPTTGNYTLVVYDSPYDYSGSSTYTFYAFQNIDPTSDLSLGSPVSGSIVNPGDEVTYTFTGTVGQNLYFNGLDSDSGTSAELIGPNGNQIFNNNINNYYYLSNDYGPFTLTTGGTYSLTIYNRSDDGGNYNFVLDDTAAAVPVALTSGAGTEVSDSIATGLSANLYQISGTAGEQITFQPQSISTAKDSDIEWNLYEPNNQTVSSGSYYSSVTTTLPTTGSYFLIVDGTNTANTSGVNYSFEVYDNVDPASILTLGSPVSGTIVNPGDEATYTFTGNVGQNLYFNGLESDPGFDAELTGPGGNSIFYQDLSSNYYRENYGPFTLSASGTYSLNISNGSDDTGDYNFVLDDTTAATPVALTSGAGTAVSDSIATGLSANLYQISGTTGEKLYFQAQTQSAGSHDVDWTLYGTADQQIANSYDWSDFSATLPAVGNYYLVVDGTNAANTSGVSYDFEVYDNVDPTSNLSPGSPVSGSIANPGDEATYTFTGTAGQALYFNGLDSSQAFNVSLSDPYGDSVFSSSTSQAAGPYTLTYGGTYSLNVSGAGAATGDYDFTLGDSSTLPTLALTPGAGAAISDTLATGTSTNLYEINGTAGEQLDLQAQSISSGNNNDLAWTLYGPGAQYIDHNNWKNFSATLPATGTYLLMVQGQNAGNTTGVSYSFEVYDNVDTTSALTLGTGVNGTITNPGDEATYNFMGTAGQGLLLTVWNADPGIDAHIKNSSGDVILSGLADQGPFLLAQTGPYTLTVSGDGASTGNYAFVLTDVSTATLLSPAATSATVSGTIAPSTGAAIYQFAGTAGETVNLTSDSFSSTSGNWFLVDPSENQIASSSFGSSFTATLAVSGTYTLVLRGSDTPVTYSFDISATAPATVAESGLPISQSGSLDAGDSISFTFNAPAGLPVYFNSLDRSFGPITAALFDPNSNVVFSDNASDNEGPFILTVPGTYTLTLTSSDSSGSDPYGFDLFSLPDTASALALGTVTSGTLDPGTTTAVYSFVGVAGQNLFLDNQQNQGDPVNLSLYDPYNNQIFAINSYQDSGPLTLTSSGTYYLLVDGESTGGPIDYQFRMIDTSASTLSFGTQLNGTLSSPASADAYSFLGISGQQVYFQALSESNGGSGASYTLFGPDNQAISAGTAYEWYNSQLTLAATGNYTLVVYNDYDDGSSTYNLEAYQNVNTVYSTSNGTFSLNTPVTGTIQNPGDSATYSFNGSVGQTLYFNGLDSVPGLYSELTGPNGNPIFDEYIGYDDDTPNNSGPFTLYAAGTYSLTVYGGGTGNYNFVLADTANATPVTLTLDAGTAVSDSIVTGLSANLYQISGTAGEQLNFQPESISTDNDSDIEWGLYGPNNQLVAGGGSSGYESFSSFTATLPTTGTYDLVVDGTNVANTSGVNYSFEVYDNIDTTSNLTIGSPVTGSIVNPGDEATYTFTGTVGQNLYFHGLDSDTGFYAVLSEPDGNQIFSQYIGSDDGTSNDYGPFTLTTGGTYSLTISNGSDDTGNYNFVLDDTTVASPVALILGAGTAVSDSIATGLSTNRYQISGTAGERLYFQAQTQSAGDFDLRWVLYGSNDQFVGGSYDWSNFSATLPATGTYYLAVDGTNAGNTSGVSYNFEVYDNVDTTSVLALGSPVNGSIANPGDEATYTFTGTAGQILYFNGLDSDGEFPVALTGPDGNQAFSYNEYTSANGGPFTLSASGTYSLTISGNAGDTGNYHFVLDDTAAATPIALTPGAGTPVSDSIATGLSANLYQISGTAGEQLYFQAQTESAGRYDLAWTLYGPNGQATSSNGWTGFSATLPTTGTYFLAVVGTNAANTSGVNYNFEIYDSVDPTSSLPLNSVVTGTIANPGDEASYAFTGSAGQLVQFNGLEPGSDLVATLDDPEGSQVSNQSIGSNAGPYTLAVPGIYTLVISGRGSAETGDYSFQLLDLASETKLQVNTIEADLTATLSAPATEEVLVQYATADGTATTADGDYKAAAGLLVFQPGQTTATVEVQAINSFTSATTYFYVNLSGPIGTATAQVTVNPVPATPPTFTADTPPTAVIGSLYSYQFQAIGSLPMTLSATDLPAWAQFDPSTGILSGTPTAPGTFNFTVTASNGNAPDAIADVALTAQYEPPTFTADTPSAAVGGFSYSYQFQAVGVGTQPITFSATGLPGWAQFNASTGVLSGTPIFDGTTYFSVTASNGIAPNPTVGVSLVVAGGLAAFTADTPPAATVGSPIRTIFRPAVLGPSPSRQRVCPRGRSSTPPQGFCPARPTLPAPLTSA